MLECIKVIKENNIIKGYTLREDDTGNIKNVTVQSIKEALKAGVVIKGLSVKKPIKPVVQNKPAEHNKQVPFDKEQNIKNFLAWQDKCKLLDYNDAEDFKFDITDSKDIRCKYIGDGSKPVILPKCFYVTSMSQMFYNCQATSLDLSNLDTSSVTNMSCMFKGCKATSLDLSNFDTSKVISMSQMFYNCQATSLDLSNFDTSNVTNMYGMLSYCYATSIDLSNFNTSNVKNMKYMFYMCLATSIDLSNFNTSKVTNMDGIFTECTSNVIVKNKQTKLIKQLKSNRCKYTIV